MTRREIASLCVHLLAIMAMLMGITVLGFGIPYLVSLFQYFDLSDGIFLIAAMVIGVVIGPGLLLVSGILLWRKAGTFAALITGQDLQDEQDEPEVIRIDAQLSDVHAVAFSLIGLWTLLSTIPEIAGLISTVMITESSLSSDVPQEVFTRIASTGILTLAPKIILGIWLLLGARTLVNWLHRVRRIGLESNGSGASHDETAEHPGQEKEH